MRLNILLNVILFVFGVYHKAESHSAFSSSMNAGFLIFSLKEDTKPLEMIISDLNKRIDELNGAGHRIENEFVVLASLPQKRDIIARKVIPVR
jgi:hypothetical protein